MNLFTNLQVKHIKSISCLIHHNRFFSLPPKPVSNNNKLPEKISLCVLGNGAEGNPRSLLIDYNDRLFMFNCGEGITRIFPDFGYKSSKVEHFFSTSNNWQNVSGLSSFLLSRYDGGIREFNITGFDNEKVIKECISFDTKLKRVKFNYFNCESKSDNSFICQSLHIKPILVEFEKNKSIVYLGTISAQKGGISLDKCFQLRVPRHLVSNLEKGIPVPLQNGEMVQPSQVAKPDEPEKRFFILESLSRNFFRSLEHSPIICDFLQRSDCIVHFTKSDFLQDIDYKSFMKSLGNSYHLLISDNNPTLCMYSTHRFQTQLNFVDPKVFPILNEKTDIPIELDKNIFFNDKVIQCQAGMSFHLRPHSCDRETLINFEKRPDFNLTNCENALLYGDGSEREGLKEAVQTIKEKQNIKLSNTDLNYPEFVFLGTASSLSLPIRNVSVILVNLSQSESVLLECGENTYGQLLRFYGQSNIQRVLNNLKAVFISHHHSDHHMGLVQLIEKHYDYTGKKLFTLLPPMVSKFLHSKSVCFSSLNNLNTKYSYAVNRYFDDRSRTTIAKLLPNLKEIQLIPVSHCAYAYAISMTSMSGFKFVYSGDTEPCDGLVEAGRNCDLLIHEATVEDSLINFARTTFHSTVSEAIDVGRRMEARFTILTHFSQRYGKLPFATGYENDQRVGLAFDNMRISPSEFYRLPLMHDALKCMYLKHLRNLEYKSELYIRKYGNSS